MVDWSVPLLLSHASVRVMDNELDNMSNDPLIMHIDRQV